MVRDVRNMLFIYDSRQTRGYLCLSTFFSLCGIMTSEKIWDENKRASYISEKSELLVFLGIEEYGESKENYIFLPSQIINASQSLLNTVLNEIALRKLMSKESLETLKKIKEIYIEEDLRKVEYNGQFYFYIQSEVEKAVQTYYRACKRIRELQKEDENNPYLWFVRGQFVRRMQCLAITSKTKKIYDSGACIEKLKEIYSENKTFVSFYALMGFLAETDDDLQKDAGEYYKKCIEASELYGLEGPQLSSVYYRWGHWCEVKMKNQSQAQDYYAKALSYDKENYRALYKVARYEEQISKKYESAWNHYDEMQNMLEKILESHYVQPVENEYLFKIYFCKWNMIKNGYYNFVDEDENRKMQEEFEQLDRKLKNYALQQKEANKFFSDFYEGEAEIYFKYMITRLRGFQRKLQ